MEKIKFLKISLLFIFAALCIIATGLFSACFLSCNRVETDPYGITYYLNSDKKSYCVYDVGLYVREAEIAEEYNGLPVTRIRSGACYDRVFMGEGKGRNLDLITIPQSIKVIEENAFGGKGYVKKIIYGGTVSDWLAITFESSPVDFGTEIYIGDELFKELTVPDGIAEINSNAFARYSYLKVLNLPDSVTKICSGAFRYCTSLKVLNIPDGVTEIGAYAFWYCTSLEEVNLGSGIDKLADSVFGGCRSIKTLNLKAVSVLSSENFSYDGGALCGCTEIENISFGGNINLFPETFKGYTALQSFSAGGDLCAGESAFEGCINLAHLSFAKFNEIGIKSFKNCSALSSLDISESDLTEIPDEAFYGCSGLSVLVLSNNIERIGDFAFSYCPLKEISVSGNLGEIGDAAFSGCGDIAEITVDVSNINYLFKNGCLISVRDNKLIKGLADCVIPQGISVIGCGAFENCTLLTQLTIPESVTAIEDLAFCNTSLTEITLPDGVTVINYGLFKECENLSSISLGGYISKIEASAFYLSGIKKITLPDSVKEISIGAFQSCYNLSEVNLGRGIKSISTWAFGDCTALEEIIIPASMEEIDGAFYNCNNLKRINFELTEGWSSEIFDELTGQWIYCVVPPEDFSEPETAAKRVTGNYYSGQFVRR